MSQEGFPENVMATIAMHKWKKFVPHPGLANPKKKPINVTLVQEFYAQLTSPTQSTVFVRGEQVQFTAAKDSANTTVERDRLVALTTMVETTQAQLEGMRNDLCTFFHYAHERDQVIRAKFIEMLPQSPMEFPPFPQSLLQPVETKPTKQQAAQQQPAENTPNPPQGKPLGSDSISSSPTPPTLTPQPKSPPTQRREGKAPVDAPTTLAVEIDSEDTVAMEEEEESRRILSPPLAPTPVRRRSTKRTVRRILVDDDKPQASSTTTIGDEEEQSKAAEEDQPTIIPPPHPTSIKHKATKKARRATT
ncbi:hypothetical protein GQ457_16G019480 [Hibiscus cannabinus]